jgi:hypothetical protein
MNLHYMTSFRSLAGGRLCWRPLLCNLASKLEFRACDGLPEALSDRMMQQGTKSPIHWEDFLAKIVIRRACQSIVSIVVFCKTTCPFLDKIRFRVHYNWASQLRDLHSNEKNRKLISVSIRCRLAYACSQTFSLPSPTWIVSPSIYIQVDLNDHCRLRIAASL